MDDGVEEKVYYNYATIQNFGVSKIKIHFRNVNNIFTMQGHVKLIKSDIYNITKICILNKKIFFTFYSSKNPEIKMHHNTAHTHILQEYFDMTEYFNITKLSSTVINIENNKRCLEHKISILEWFLNNDDTEDWSNNCWKFSTTKTEINERYQNRKFLFNL